MGTRIKRLGLLVLGVFVVLHLLHLSGQTASQPLQKPPTSLRRRLNKQFACPHHEPIPRRVWQSWKSKSNLDKEFEHNVETWSSAPDYQHHLLDDAEVSEFVKHRYAAIPEVVEAFERLPRKVLKADFFRYLVILAEGGTYADIDTSLTTPMDEWLRDGQLADLMDRANVPPSGIAAVIGVEDECDCWGWRGIFTRRLQFCQWSFQAKRGHPLFVDLVAKITELTLHNYNPHTQLLTFPTGYKGMPNMAPVYNMSQGSDSWYHGVLEWTGPGAFTDSVFKYLNDLYLDQFTEIGPQGTSDMAVCRGKSCLLDPNKPLDLVASLQNPPPLNDNLLGRRLPDQPVGWENFTLIQEPLLFGDVAILPKAYFNSKYAQEPGTKNYVHHGFKGTWKWLPDT